MVADEIVKAVRSKNIIERALAGEAPECLAIEEVCMLITESEEVDQELLQNLIQACLRRELRASEKRFDRLGRPLKEGTTYWVEHADMKPYLVDRGINYDPESALGRWLENPSTSAGRLRPCQMDKQLVQMHCMVAWEINPSWKLSGTDGILALIDRRLLQQSWDKATLLRWAREVRPARGKPGRPRNEEIEFDE
jgi:hypothetical protein